MQLDKIYNVGVIAGNFDIIHLGYIRMFKECKLNCKRLIVLLHTDPSIERKNKLSPIHTIQERKEILSAIKYIDDIQVYDYEKELIDLLNKIKPAVRFLGSDYINKKYTGDHLNIPIYYINRDHGWSATKLKNLIKIR